MAFGTEQRRVALVTGCSEPQSLGVATVRHLQSKGWRVIATARKAETMQALSESGVDVRPASIIHPRKLTLVDASSGYRLAIVYR
jgi:NADP-dependent 3-hydroxy acid dehydrogenase YdfG